VSDRKTFALGIDVGGTTVKGATVDRRGKILDQCTSDTMAGKGPKAVISQITLTIDQLLAGRKKSDCMGIGMGIPGVVSPGDGVVSYPPNFADWKEVELQKLLHKHYALPVTVENDANVAAMAESRYGAAKSYPDFLFVIWGSGVGGGIILDHKIFRGPSGGAGEVGHVTVKFDGPLCNCGNRGCIEAYIGQRYLSKRTRDLLESRPGSMPRSKIYDFVGGDLSKIEPAVISRAALAGDRTAIGILEEAGELLGAALASAFNILDLRIAVIGGGVSAVPEFVYASIKKSLRSRVLKSHKPGLRVLRAELGNAAGILGAASLAM
jgi:glucokinase